MAQGNVKNRFDFKKYSQEALAVKKSTVTGVAEMPREDTVIVQKVQDGESFDLTKIVSEKIRSIPVWDEYSQEEKISMLSAFIDYKSVEMKIVITQDEKDSLINNILNSASDSEKHINDEEMADFLISYLDSGKHIQIKTENDKTASVFKSKNGYIIKAD